MFKILDQKKLIREKDYLLLSRCYDVIKVVIYDEQKYIQIFKQNCILFWQDDCGTYVVPQSRWKQYAIIELDELYQTIFSSLEEPEIAK